MDLFKEIEAKAKNDFEAKQLMCISMLVYYCGIRRGEIPNLEVKDVIDKAGQVSVTIDRFKKKLIKLNCETSAAIQSYYNDLKSRNPTLAKRRSPLFPSLQNESKLRRVWKAYNTKFIDIRHAGIKDYYKKCLSSGMDRKSILNKGEIQYRITGRELEAVALDNKIPPGESPDAKLTKIFIESSDRAGRLDGNDSAVQREAATIINDFDKHAKKIKLLKQNKKYQYFRNMLLDQLSPHLTIQNP